MPCPLCAQGHLARTAVGDGDPPAAARLSRALLRGCEWAQGDLGHPAASDFPCSGDDTSPQPLSSHARARTGAHSARTALALCVLLWPSTLRGGLLRHWGEPAGGLRVSTAWARLL